MVAFKAKCIIGAGLIVAGTLTSTFAATVVPGGVIHFRGAIVEDPCEVTPRQQNFTLTCPGEGKRATREISYPAALKGENSFPNVATVSMKYLNPEKSLAVMQIDYR